MIYGIAIKSTSLLFCPLIVTDNFPLTSPSGTFTTIEVEFQLLYSVAFVLLKLTILVPFVVPNPVPVIVI